jgi:hypothetical protein
MLALAVTIYYLCIKYPLGMVIGILKFLLLYLILFAADFNLLSLILNKPSNKFGVKRSVKRLTPILL